MLLAVLEQLQRWMESLPRSSPLLAVMVLVASAGPATQRDALRQRRLQAELHQARHDRLAAKQLQQQRQQQAAAGPSRTGARLTTTPGPRRSVPAPADLTGFENAMTLAIVNDSSQPRNVLFDYFAADDEDDDRPLRFAYHAPSGSGRSPRTAGLRFHPYM